MRSKTGGGNGLGTRLALAGYLQHPYSCLQWNDRNLVPTRYGLGTRPITSPAPLISNLVSVYDLIHCYVTRPTLLMNETKLCVEAF